MKISFLNFSTNSTFQHAKNVVIFLSPGVSKITQSKEYWEYKLPDLSPHNIEAGLAGETLLTIIPILRHQGLTINWPQSQPVSIQEVNKSNPILFKTKANPTHLNILITVLTQSYWFQEIILSLQ